MKSKKVAVLSALALTLTMGLMIFGGRRVQAAGTWYVNSTTGNDSFSCMSAVTPCKTINAAIGKAASGDTINVAAGTYNEQVSINKDSLTLLGAQHGVDARNPRGAESIINNSCGPVQFHANKDTLDGFTVQGSTDPDPCFLSGIWMNPGFDGVDAGHQILNNVVQNNISGIELDSTGVFPTKVQFNLIRNNSNPGHGSGNGIQVNFGLSNALIDNNTFSGDTSSSILDASFSGTDGNITVSNNQLIGGSAESIAFIAVKNTTISGNTSVGSTSSATIDLFGGNNGITITCNTLAAGQRGIFVENPYASYGVLPNSNITANQNNIQGNVIAGLEVATGSYFGGSLNATNNWWGSPTGPTHPSNFGGTGDKIIDPDGAVTFIPFLTSPSPCAPVPDFCPADPNKTEPGVCGCGVPDTDTDHDGTPDCNDKCPNDPNKIAPGVCGCGHPDVDTDHDGTLDCNDACPTDPHKIAPGACGCGHPETPGCTTTKKDCQKFFEKKEEAFEDQQKAAKKAFDSQPHTKQQKKTFEDQQEAAEKAFHKQNEIDEKQCDSLPKGGKDDKDDKKDDKGDKHDH